ncbi:MAG: hypothetical protein RLY14_3407 [Planctomycetota bacterium]
MKILDLPLVNALIMIPHRLTLDDIVEAEVSLHVDLGGVMSSFQLCPDICVHLLVFINLPT